MRGRQESRHGLRRFRKDRTRHRRQPWHRRSHRGRARRGRRARKVYAAARSLSALGPLVARHGSRVVPLELDVTNTAQVAAAAATAADVDSLVNNAGIVGFFGGDFLRHPSGFQGGRQEMEVNFLGDLRGHAGVCARRPAKNGRGAIANLNSVASFVSFPIVAVTAPRRPRRYSLTQVTRAMLRGQNTQVFGVYPGPIDTKMGEVMTMEKASPVDAARAIVAGIIAGEEEILPDKMSRDTGPAFFADSLRDSSARSMQGSRPLPRTHRQAITATRRSLDRGPMGLRKLCLRSPIADRASIR